MKRPISLGVLLMGGLGAASAAPQMSESAAEFFGSADFDGDGRLDSLIIDKPAGVMRIGYQTAPETWTWAPARPTGAVPVAAVAVGRLLDTARDAIAVTAPAANRVLVHPATSTSVPGTPVAHSPMVGPDALAPVPLSGSGGVAGRDQILTGSGLDPSATPYVLAGLEGGTGGRLFMESLHPMMRRGQPVLLKTGTNWRAAFLADGIGGTELRVYDGSTLGLNLTLASPGVPTGSHFASAMFNTGSALAQVVLWTPGAPQLRVRPVTEPAAGTFALGAETIHTLSGGITQLMVLDDPAGPRLLVIFDDGASASVFTFNGSAAPGLVSTLTPAVGERFRAGSLSGGGGFLLASAAAASARSQTFRPYRRASASTYTPLASASLPAVTTSAGRANVLLFAAPPFVSETARPLAALHAADWTRSVTISGGSVSAVGETFAGSAAGLDNPVSYPLGSALGASDTLANQFEPWLSISSLRAVHDSPDIEPAIAPKPGRYERAQQLSFSAPAGVTVYFKAGAAPWQQWTGAPTWLLEDTSVLYYGHSSPSRNSALRTANYTFAMDGAFLDSDHDGVPDFVEIEHGLDPSGGPDSDGDGWGDDAELLAGTDPADAAIKPGDPLPVPPRSDNTGVNLTATLQSWRGHAPDVSLVPAAGTRVDAIDTTGAPIASRTTEPGLDQIVIDDLAVPAHTVFISLTTAASWQRSDGADIFYGSQAVALVPAPAPPDPLIINYVAGGGSPAAEAAAWVAALAAAEAAQTPRNLTATLSPIDSLVGLLVEKKVDDILISRGADSASRLSLIDTGLTDAGARRVSAAALAALELPGPANEPAWKLGQVHTLIDLGVKASPGSAAVQALRLLAADIFESFESVWQPPTAADPDGTTAAFPAPIDLLRSLIRGNPLPAGYLAVTTLTGAQISSAQGAIVSILALPVPRPQVTLTLSARADSWRPDCTVFNNGGTTVALVEHDGTPWRFQGSVALPATALLQVRGFTDRPPPPPTCAASTLEVISATVQSLPGGSVPDSDLDGLGDAWERVFFGSLGQSGGGDFDSDGSTNAQEFTAGTDPADHSPGGGVSPFVFLGPLPIPDLGISLAATGTLELTWDCTEECRRTLIYSLEWSSSELRGSWQLTSAVPDFLPDGRMRFTVDSVTPGQSFFRVRVTRP